MKFNPIEDSDSIEDIDNLTQEFNSAVEVCSIRLGDSHLFYKKLLKIYYIPYKNLKRAYRRVTLVQAKMCCASGQLKEESFVLHNSKDQEVAMIPVESEKAGKRLLEELAERSPDTILSCPEKSDKAEKSKEGSL